MKKATACIFALLLHLSLFAQVNISNYQFVNVPSNAHVAGLGGVNVSVPDLNMVFQNPGLIRSEMSKVISVSYVPYFADIKNTSVSYVHSFRDFGPLAMGLQYSSSGKMQQTDDVGNDLGTFSVNQYVLQAGSSHKIDNYSLGVNVKFAGSSIGPYSSYALLSDLGGVFKHPTRDFTVGMVVKNMGFSIKKYRHGEDVNMPLDIQLGTSYKLEHMPFRFSVMAHHLQKFDVVYLDTTQSTTLDDLGNPIKPHKTVGDKIGRHFIVGGEFFIGKGFTLRFGYNYQRRRELRLETKPALAGFSFGGAIKIKSFEFAFTQAYYSSTGGSSFLTLNTTLNTLFKKKSPVEQL